MSKKLLLIVALLLSSMSSAFAATEVNINSATQEQLEAIIPGDATAKKHDAQEIVRLRNEKRFESHDDFAKRFPIKPRILQQMKDAGAVVK